MEIIVSDKILSVVTSYPKFSFACNAAIGITWAAGVSFVEWRICLPFEWFANIPDYTVSERGWVLGGWAAINWGIVSVNIIIKECIRKAKEAVQC